MPFDGTNGPFREPHRNGRPGPSRMQRLFRGWRPIERGERERRWARRVIACMLRLRGAHRELR